MLLRLWTPAYLLTCAVTFLVAFLLGRTLRSVEVSLPGGDARRPVVPLQESPPPAPAVTVPPRPSARPWYPSQRLLDAWRADLAVRRLSPAMLLALALQERGWDELGTLGRQAREQLVQRAGEAAPLAPFLLTQLEQGTPHRKAVCGEVLAALPTLDGAYLPRLGALIGDGHTPYDVRKGLLALVERLGPAAKALAPVLEASGGGRARAHALPAAAALDQGPLGRPAGAPAQRARGRGSDHAGRALILAAPDRALPLSGWPAWPPAPRAGCLRPPRAGAAPARAPTRGRPRWRSARP